MIYSLAFVMSIEILGLITLKSDALISMAWKTYREEFISDSVPMTFYYYARLMADSI